METPREFLARQITAKTGEERLAEQRAIDEYYNELSDLLEKHPPGLPRPKYQDKNKIKVDIYERILHKIQMWAEITHSNEKLRDLIGLICSWSYAHRSGNGEHSEEEQDKLVDNALKRINDYISGPRI